MENREQLPLVTAPNAGSLERPQARLFAFSLTSDFWFVARTALIVLALTSLPYIYGFLSTPPGKQFMGIMLDVPDHAQYFSWMHDLASANLISNRMTPEFNQPIFFNLLWWLMGRTAGILDVGFAGMYQILRLGATVVFLALVFVVSGLFLKERSQRRTMLLIATFTSGFGWVLVLSKYFTHAADIPFPMDVYTAEGNTFLGILGYPHFIAAAAYILVFFLVLRGQERSQFRYAIAAGLVALFLGWQHTYDLVSVYTVLFAYAVLVTIRDRKLPSYLIKSGLIIGILSCSPAIYSVWLTSADPIWKKVLAQFANAGVYTPNPLHLIVLLGPAFLLAIYTAIRKRPLKLKGKSNNDLFLMGWFLVTFPLVYLPVDFRIHLLNGWQVPIAVLATQGLFDHIIPFVENKASPFLSPKWAAIRSFPVKRAMIAVFLLAIIPTNIYLLTWRFTDLARHDYPYYLSKDEINAMDWIAQHAGPNDVVMSSLTIGQYIPVITGSHAYLAHWAQTLDFFNKTAAVTTFYSALTSTDQRQAILRQGNVAYVFSGPAENALGNASLSSLQNLKPVFTEDNVVVYAVQWDTK